MCSPPNSYQQVATVATVPLPSPLWQTGAMCNVSTKPVANSGTEIWPF